MSENNLITDEVLIRRFQDGDNSAYEILVNKYKNVIIILNDIGSKALQSYLKLIVGRY